MLPQHPRVDEFSLASLRTIAYAGSSMPVETLRRAMARLPGADYVKGFGMTELSGNDVYFDPDLHRLAATQRPELLAAAGHTMALSRIRVDDDMRDVAVGRSARSSCRTKRVMLGYWRRPEANEEAFAGGWFHTGDLRRVDEQGHTAIVDRKKDTIVTGGENVYSKEVEDVIYAAAGVAEASIIGVPDPHWGENVTPPWWCRPPGRRSPPRTSWPPVLPPSPATRSRSRCSPSTSCRATPAARSSSASSATASADATRPPRFRRLGAPRARFS
jgi:acyl-CoA synthetase (AMP-forming)/AMP-acid ligase II